MASVDVLPMPTSNQSFTPLESVTSTKRKRNPESNIPTELIDMISMTAPEKVAFDAEKHLNFVPPTKIYSMKEIGHEDKGVSPNAVSEPFQLFTEGAINQMRAETLRKEVIENCQYSSNLGKGQLRGFAPEYVTCSFFAYWMSS